MGGQFPGARPVLGLALAPRGPPVPGGGGGGGGGGLWRPPLHAPAPPPPRPAHLAGAKFGVLTLTVESAQDIPSVEGNATASLDAYVVARVGVVEQATPTCAGGGTRPVFRADLTFDIRAEREVDLSFFFRRGATAAGFDDVCVGRGRANFMPWVAAGSFQGEVQLRDGRNEPAGSVRVSSRFARPAAPARPGAPAAAAAAAAPPAQALAVVGAGPPPAAGAGPGATELDPFSREELRAAFDYWDINQRGSIGAEEICGFMLKIDEAVTAEEVDIMIHLCDSSGSGRVGFNDFMRVLLDAKKPSGGESGGAQGDAGGAGTLAARNAKKTALTAFAEDTRMQDGRGALALECSCCAAPFLRHSPTHLYTHSLTHTHTHTPARARPVAPPARTLINRPQARPDQT